MTSTQTLRTLGAATLGAVVVAIAALSVRTGPVSGAPAVDTPATHTITVSATGKITVVPDVARLNLGVTATKSTVKAAREAGAKAMTDIIAALKGLGIADADIQTTNLSLYPQYAQGPTPKVVGYQISEQLQVTVRDIDKAGDAVDAATAKGATDVNGISFDVADPVKAQNDARAAAVEAARVSAQSMASAGHVSLGAVVSITDATPPISPIYFGGVQGRRRRRYRDPGPARDAGPVRDGHRGVRDQLTDQRPAALSTVSAWSVRTSLGRPLPQSTTSVGEVTWRPASHQACDVAKRPSGSRFDSRRSSASAARGSASRRGSTASRTRRPARTS